MHIASDPRSFTVLIEGLFDKPFLLICCKLIVQLELLNGSIRVDVYGERLGLFLLFPVYLHINVIFSFLDL